MGNKVNINEETIRLVLGGDRIKDQKGLDVLTKEVYSIVKDFEPQDPIAHMRLASLLSGHPTRIKFNEQDKVFKALTGYDFKELQMMMMKLQNEQSEVEQSLEDDRVEPDIVDSDVVENDALKPVTNDAQTRALNIVNNILHPVKAIANINLINMYASAIAVIDTTTKIQAKTNVQKALKGVLVSAEVVTGLAVLPTITGVVGAARIGTKVAKFLKGRKDRRAEIMHKNALRNMEETKEGLEIHQEVLKKSLEERSIKIDEKAQETGMINSDFYKQIHESRHKKGNSFKERQDIIADGFDSATSLRDGRLCNIVSRDAISCLQEVVGIDEFQAKELIGRQLKIDENGELYLDNESGIDIDSLNETQKRVIKNAIRSSAKIPNISEDAKRSAFDCLEVVDGRFQLKPTVDMSEFPKDVVSLVENLMHRPVTENDMKFFNQAHECIDLIVECEQELLEEVALDTTNEMLKSVEQSKEKMSQQRGFIRSTIEIAKSNLTRMKAESIVSGRISRTLTDSMDSHSNVSKKLIALAQERLQLDKEQSVAQEPEKTLGEEEREN